MIHDDPMTAVPPRLDDVPPARTSPWTRVTLVALLVILVCGATWAVKARSKANAAQAEAAARAAAEHVTPVLTSPAMSRDVPIWREGLGNVTAYYTVTVKTQVDGRIDKVFFREGQKVKAGEVLIQIDPRPFQIQLLSAQAALERDQAQLKNGQLNADRYKTLSQQNLIAVQQYTDQAATVAQLDGQVKTDVASIESAKLNLDYARITSPIDGVVGVRLVDPGNVVHATDTTGLVVVTQLDPIALIFTLPEDDLTGISQAMSAGGPLSVDAFSRDGMTRLATGQLSVIDNQINSSTATLRLKAIFPNPQSILWPNEFVKARLYLTTLRSVVVVPTAALQRGPQGTFVYVVGPDSTATVRPVQVALTQGEIAVVSKGVNIGDAVVVEGQAQLRPGAKVLAKPASAQTTAAATPSASSAQVGPGGSSP
ncbi:MAG TPA: efflux RND transporter periplasmic adaptor subunit [Polyangiaceae bacterium]|nr:efflux RND transporter periplasmic adaptor subunit [Polyangiaceae bacterium]